MLSFMGIGAQKSGTSWLYETLANHPDVAFPGGKEVHFWDSHRARGIDWYRELFAHAAPCNGDITPAYGILSRAQIAEVHSHFPDLRLIFLMRNPLDRAWSSARMAVRRAEMRVEEASDAWFIDHFNSEGSLTRGDYATCLTHWLGAYPKEQVLVARYENISADPVALANRALRHIGLAPYFGDAHRQQLSLPVFAGSPYPLRPALREVLLRLYAAKIEALSHLLGEDFSDWTLPQ